MSTPYKFVEIPFEVTPLGIDQFIIPVGLLRGEGNKVSRIQYEPEDDPPYSQLVPEFRSIGYYLSGEKLKAEAATSEKVTVVIDLPVGKGKTTGSYDLIAEYAKDTNMVILVASPFRKLVEKDYNALKHDRKLHVFSYMELPKEKEEQGKVIEKALKNNVHIIVLTPCKPGQNL